MTIPQRMREAMPKEIWMRLEDDDDPDYGIEQTSEVDGIRYVRADTIERVIAEMEQERLTFDVGDYMSVCKWIAALKGEAE